MVIGGQAVLLYGEPRLTRDIDVTPGVSAERAEDLTGMAQHSAWQVLVPKPDEFVRQTMVMPCLDPKSGIRADFIFSWSPHERQALGRVRRVPIGPVEVHFSSPEDVIIHKGIAGCPLTRGIG